MSRYFRPTSATQFCLLTLYLSAPVLSTFELLAWARTHRAPKDSSVHADVARFGGTARSKASCSLADFVATFASDASVATPVSFLDLSAERASWRGCQGHFHEHAVTQCSLS